MPALIKKSIRNSFSKKWNSVRGGWSVDEAPVLPQQGSTEDSDTKRPQMLTRNYDGCGYSLPQPPNLSEDVVERTSPSPNYDKTEPEALVVSDISSDDDTYEDEKNEAEMYGYGEAAPDYLSEKWSSVLGGGKNSKTGVDKAPVLPQQTSTEDIDTPCPQMLTYGYFLPQPPNRSEDVGETSPPSSNDEKTEPEAVVDSDTSSNDDSLEDEKDAAEMYGYGEAAPDVAAAKLPRRLSTRRGSIGGARRCRSSICSQQPLTLNEGDGEKDENLPFDPHRMPRRSSFKGSCPQRAERRRASIGCCTMTPAERSISIEKEIAIGAIDPSQVLELCLPGRRDSIKRRRSIQFNEDVNVRKIQPTSEVKGAVKKELWFQDDEYSTIKKKNRALMYKVDSNGIVNGKKYCTRGLEKYMDCPERRVNGRYHARDSVFMEQEMQRKLKIFDEDSMGRFYTQTSTMSVIEATNRGNLDAREVASFYEPQQQNENQQQQQIEQQNQQQPDQREGYDESAPPPRRRIPRRASIA